MPESTVADIENGSGINIFICFKQCHFRNAVLTVVLRKISIRTVNARGGWVVRTEKQCKLSVIKPVGKIMRCTVGGNFHVWNSYRFLYFFVSAYGIYNALFQIVITFGYENRKLVWITEYGFRFTLGYLRCRRAGSIDTSRRINILRLKGKITAYDDCDQKYRRNDVTKFDVEFADSRNFGDEALMCGFIDCFTEIKRDARHKQENGNHTANNALCKHDTQIGAKSQSHCRECKKSRNRRQGRTCYFGNSFCKCRSHSFLRRQPVCLFFRKSMAENNGIVDGKRKL